MLQHGQHIMPSIMLSMEDMEGSMVSNRDNSSPSNLLSSLKHRSNSQHHPNRIMLNRVSVRKLQHCMIFEIQSELFNRSP